MINFLRFLAFLSSDQVMIYKNTSLFQYSNINLCNLALDFKKKSGRKAAQIYDLPKEDLTKALETNNVVVEKSNHRALGFLIVSLVNTKCTGGCLLAE